MDADPGVHKLAVARSLFHGLFLTTSMLPSGMGRAPLDAACFEREWGFTAGVQKPLGSGSGGRECHSQELAARAGQCSMGP
eukprot:12001899-Alexandrium_andersonii.AAC.1